MDEQKRLAVIVRELTALGAAWRGDWSDFDGRTLRHQLDGICVWITALDDTDFTEFTEFAHDKEF